MARYLDEYTLKINVDGKQALKDTGTAAKETTSVFKRLGPAIKAAAAPLAGFAVGAVIKNRIDDFDALAKSARAAGATGSEEAFRGFQAMKFALAEAGVEAGTADRAFLNISQRMREGAEGGKAFAGIFETMKDQVTDANGELKSSPEVLQAFINAVNDGTISADEFQKVVGGRAGPVILQAFAGINDTAEKLNNTLVEAAGNADIVGLDAAENAEVFNDNIGRLKEGMMKLLTEAITPLLPHLVNLSENLLKNMPQFIEGVKAAFEDLKPVFDLIGVVLTDVVFPVLDKVFKVLGSIASAITPLVEAAIPALQAGFEGIVAIVEGVIAVFTRAIELLGTIGEKAVALKEKVGGALSSAREGISNVASAAGQRISGAATATGEAIEDFFAGFFANGGTIPAGKFGVVGERGAELVAGPGTVIPMDGMGQNVTYNIQAVDAASFRALVAREPDFIHAVAQKGARRFAGGR